MNKPRPATIPQLYRLNQLNCLKLMPISEGDQINFTDADKILADAEREGLWTPKHPRTRDD